MSYFINKKTGEIITASSIKEASKKVTANFLYAKEKSKVIPKISALVKEIAKEYGFEVKKDAKKMGDADYFEWYLIKGKHGTTCDAKIDITLGVYLRFNAFNCRTFAEVTKANIASFETFKKYLLNSCEQLFKKTKITSSYETTALNVDRLSPNVKKAYDELNERFCDYHGKIYTKELIESIRLAIDNNQALYKQIKNKRVKIHSVVWYALEEVFNKHLDWAECRKLSSEQIKNWFAYNNTDYKTALKKVIDDIENMRKEYLEEGL